MSHTKLLTRILILSLLPLIAHAERSKVIDFEGAVVEGLNKKPLDSFSQLSEKDKKRKRLHLYKKRKGFRFRTRQTLKEMRYL
ncbi:MAG: hypothetical protein CL678_08320 [Bdellovibrionaceae bacterium]|nr:hypothetical protein [Pseudobdellovibrionaceae bacterium]|tara:strand:+ start:913 stop:1161 length:249 start_codon:yes stop_codon:yes gene_type:complete